MAEQHRDDDVVVLLGTPNAESTRLYALTVTEGDPSWAGALAGIPLGLSTYHIVEDPVKTQIPSELYDEHIALMEMVLEVDDITKAAQDVRTAVGNKGNESSCDKIKMHRHGYRTALLVNEVRTRCVFD